MLKRARPSYSFGFILGILFLYSVQYSFAAESSEDSNPVLVRAMSDQAGIQPGGSFRIGVLFELESPWHIYWKNPGDAGLPTKIQLTLPDEFTAGELHWPTPITFAQAGGIHGYGYVKEAFFWQEVSLSPDSTLSGDVEIPLSIRWLRCSDSLCVPGRSKQKVKVSVGDTKESPEKAVFQEWEGRYPISEDEFAKQGSLSLQQGISGKKPWRVSVSWQGEIQEARWYLLADNAFKLTTKPRTGTSIPVVDGQSTFSIEVKPLDGVTPKTKTLEALVVFKTKEGIENSFSIPVTDNL